MRLSLTTTWSSGGAGEVTRPFPRGITRYTIHSHTSNMQTWSVFSGSDLTLALVGFIGFASVAIVLRTAFGNVANRELTLRRNARSQSNASDS